MLVGLFGSCKNREDFKLSDLQNDKKISDEGSDKDIKENTLGDQDSVNNDFRDDEKILDKRKSEINNKIFVHVCGCVKNPDVYKLDEGARAIDAIRLAGGFLKDAKKDYVNLAAILNDQDKLYIPCENEVTNVGFLPADVNGNMSSDGKININTADKEELMRLSGIGSSRADDIIGYRKKNGSFKKIEDIMQISGIKKAMFEKIKDEISVN